MFLSNQALTDELEAVNSIYDAETLQVRDEPVATGVTSAVLHIPEQPFAFVLSFPSGYPDVPPIVVGTQSTGPSTRKGEGEAAVTVLRDVLGRIFVPGQVCLFDLIEEASPLFGTEDHTKSDVVSTASDTHHDSFQSEFQSSTDQSVFSTLPMSAQLSSLSVQDLNSFVSTSTAITSIPTPNWTVSDSLVVNKSTFVGRALAADSLAQVRSSISHLLATNKKVASATHNITAWRIKQNSAPTGHVCGGSERPDGAGAGAEIVIQDCDDDGETAAGGRLLHLLQLMDVWNVVVVVTRWYGGVRLGSDRFRCINSVGREALVQGNFVKASETKGKAKGKKK